MIFSLLKRRTWCMLALTCAFAAAQAQGFPDRPISIVVPFPPGGTTDILARLVADKMTRDLKTTVIVENRPGGGGNLGAELVARAKPDGYTILLSAAGPLSINQHLYSKLNYNPIRDFTSVSLIASVPIMLVTHPDRPFQSVAELIVYAKANPGKLSYGSQGNGTTSHLTMELLKTSTGINLVHVPYRGSSPATNDLVGGQIDLMFDNSPSTLPFVQSKRLRALGVASANRVKGMESVPAIAETVVGFESTAWFGVAAPAGTPETVLQTLNRSINSALDQPDLKKRMAASGVDLLGGSTSEMTRFMENEIRKWAEVVKLSGAKLD